MKIPSDNKIPDPQGMGNDPKIEGTETGQSGGRIYKNKEEMGKLKSIISELGSNKKSAKTEGVADEGEKGGRIEGARLTNNEIKELLDSLPESFVEEKKKVLESLKEEYSSEIKDSNAQLIKEAGKLLGLGDGKKIESKKIMDKIKEADGGKIDADTDEVKDMLRSWDGKVSEFKNKDGDGGKIK